MDWKKFFKPTLWKIIVFIILIVLSFFLGFFHMSNCFIDENGEELCRMCGVEGIFNPILRPISFIIGNIFGGLISNNNIQMCGAMLLIYSLYPFDLIWLYFFISITCKKT